MLELFSAGILGFLLLACGTIDREIEPVKELSSANIVEQDLSKGDNEKMIELTALVSSQEEAEKTAELYGIDLVSYSSGIAVYSTDKNLGDLNALGQKNGYPRLSLNQEMHLD